MLPISPTIEEMFTIRPEPRSIMCGKTACDMKNAPERLTAITLYQSSSDIFRTVLSIVIPALLIPCAAPKPAIQADVTTPHLLERVSSNGTSARPPGRST